MKLGMFMMPLHPPARNQQDVLQEDVEKAVLADSLGFEELWVGEHFSATSEPIPAPMIFLAAVMGQTRRIKLGTGVINLPNHNPAIVAAEVAFLDQLSGGRLLFGIGPGGLASDYELFENESALVRGEKMLESIDIILRLWSQDPPYDIAGKYYKVRIADAIIPRLGVGYLSKPLQRPHPPIALSATSPFSGSVKTAAMRGWGPISANFIPDSSVASHWTTFLEGCEAVKRKPDGDDWRVARNVIVAPTDEEARERALDPNGSNFYYFRYVWDVLVRSGFATAIKSDPNVPDSEITIEALIEDLVIYGSPKTVVEKISAFREKVGPFGTLLLAAMDWEGVNRAREIESMSMLAKVVMPQLGKIATAA
jgi:alkanesulfonate monooxygenase SsuD/methylene tetrahydromethanopterin reductase-like flavin-dependent oxidoreductase (luciferase family)